MDAFAEFYFGGLLDKSTEQNVVQYEFYDGIRTELIQYISVEEVKALFYLLNEVISSSLELKGSVLDLLFSKNQNSRSLGEKEKELASLLIQILGEKGQFFEKEIENLVTKSNTIHPKTNTYQMGSNEHDDEKPVHQITFDYNFEIAKTPVTFEEYDLYCEDTKTKKPDDEGWGRGQRPVINVSWDDAQAYCKWLSKKTNKEYRLPTEAEWEYACRAGTNTKWSFGDDEKELGKYAWYDKNFFYLGKEHKDYGTHTVGEKEPNPWGLYDIHGNVQEWCQDNWVDHYNDTPRDGTAYKGLVSRVVRGGSWDYDAFRSRSAFRDWSIPSIRFRIRGFRILRTLP